MRVESQKWLDYADSVPITDDDGKKALELVREQKGLFLYIKCSDNKHKKQYNNSINYFNKKHQLRTHFAYLSQIDLKKTI